MNCEEVQELLSPYVDNMLGTGESNLVSQHLKTCSECLHEYQRLNALISMLKTLGDEDLPEGFNERLVSRLRQSRRKKFLIPSWAPVGAVAAVLIVLFLGFSPGLFQLDEIMLETPHSQHDQAANEEGAESPGQKTGAVEDFAVKSSPGMASENSESTTQDLGGGAAEEPSPGLGNGFTTFDRNYMTSALLKEGSRGKTGVDSEKSLLRAGAVPADRSEEDVSVTSVPNGQVLPLSAFMHIIVESLDSASSKLNDVTALLGGELKPAPLNGALTENINEKQERFIASVPSGLLASLIDSVSELGLVEGYDFNGLLLNSETEYNKLQIQELQTRKEYLADLLTHTSEAEVIEQLQQEIYEIDLEIIEIQLSPLKKTDLVQINIVVEEKGK